MSKQQYEPSKEELGLQARFILERSMHTWQVPEKIRYLSYLNKRAGLPFGTIGLIQQKKGETVIAETPYASRQTTVELGALHNISCEQRKEHIDESTARYTYRAINNDTGRFMEAVGACSLGGLTGQWRENKVLHAETKAKRRATLEVCGLAFLDDTEVDDMDGAVRVEINEDLPKSAAVKGLDSSTSATPAHASPPVSTASSQSVAEAPKPPAGTPKVESVTIVEAPPVVALAFEPPARYKDQAALFQGEPGSIELLTERITLIVAEGKDKTGWGGQALSSWLNEAFGITMKNKGETLTVDKFREIMAIIDKTLTEAGR